MVSLSVKALGRSIRTMTAILAAPPPAAASAPPSSSLSHSSSSRRGRRRSSCRRRRQKQSAAASSSSKGAAAAAVTLTLALTLAAAAQMAAAVPTCHAFAVSALLPSSLPFSGPHTQLSPRSQRAAAAAAAAATAAAPASAASATRARRFIRAEGYKGTLLRAAGTSSTPSSQDGFDTVTDDERHRHEAQHHHHHQQQQQHDLEAERLAARQRNKRYIATLTTNLSSALQSYEKTRSRSSRRRALNIIRQIEREARYDNDHDYYGGGDNERERGEEDDEGGDKNNNKSGSGGGGGEPSGAVRMARRMAERIGMPLHEPTDDEDDDDENGDGDGRNESSSPSSGGGDNSSGGGDENSSKNELNIDSDAARRKAEAEARKRWEAARPGGIRPAMNTAIKPNAPITTNRLADFVRRNIGSQPQQQQRQKPGSTSTRKGRSILSTRADTNGGKPDLMLGSIDKSLDPNDDKSGGGDRKKKSFPGNVVATGQGSGSTTRRAFDPSAMANNLNDFKNYMSEKTELDKFADVREGSGNNNGGGNDESAGNSNNSADEDDNVRELAAQDDVLLSGEAQASELVARAGAGSSFKGESLGIGGLDDVLAQVKRRVWVPLAAPPSLLSELGINPVRGLLLYGLPGCGKTLLARSLGKILSPARPITVVSGPEIMDRFVGSSEANLREIFDNPPDIYDSFRVKYADMGAALAESAIHVIVLDEFDAIARARGGGDGKGGQGDAGVARDSVVNQMLAKMDGIDPLVVPTLVIGLTNKRSLIEPALLRPGRFEVQIEVPKPRTKEQRMSILKVHMNSMYEKGRLYVNDPPAGSAAARRLEKKRDDSILSYDELIDLLAVECDGMSGASLAAVARAAASRALERAVYDFAGHVSEGDDGASDFGEGGSIADCLVTQADLERAIEDVFESSKEGDGGDKEDEEEDAANDEAETSAAEEASARSTPEEDDLQVT